MKFDGRWAAPCVAILCSGSEGRAAIERRVRKENMVVKCMSLDDYRRDFAAAGVLVAHNSGHECAMEDYLLPDLAAMRAQKYETCTASRARRLSLPGSLEDACKVLKTPHQKSKDGHGVMLQCSQPRPSWLSRGVGTPYFDDAERLARVAIYCVEDILAECDLDDYLAELPPTERRYWALTEKVNRRGVPLDVPLIDAMSAAIAEEQRASLARVAEVTGNPDFALTNPGAIVEFCKSRGLWLADLRKETVEATLRAHDDGVRPIDEAARTVLEARRDVGGKTSLGKLPKMRSRVMSDSRIRDNMIYHGAHTGRLTGEGINLLNLPRPYKKFDQDKVVDFFMRGDLVGLRASQGVSVSTAASAALRGVIVPGRDRKFVVGDYKSVEPCFYFTMARQWDAVEILRTGGDIYCEVATTIYGRRIEAERDKIERQVGKVIVLAAAYGMGLTKFSAVADATPGVDLSDEMKERAHAGYRRRFPRIPDAWKGLESAARAALRNVGATYDFNGVQYVSDGWWLVCLLPSGRPFYYPNARLQPGKYDDEIIYEGWQRIDNRPAGWGDVRTWGGSLLENVTQAVCRDVMEEDQETLEALPGWEIDLTVYDELVANVPNSEVDAVSKMKGITERPRPWFPNMPVRADIHQMDRYAKR
jgi:DNA polymerase